MILRPIILYEDAAARALEPFALLRPLTEMRAGAVLVRERWEPLAHGEVAGRVGAPHLDSFDETGTPPTVSGLIPAGTIIANARFLPALGAPLDDATAWTADGRVLAVRLAESLDPQRLADGTLALESLVRPGTTPAVMRGWWIDYAWDFIRHLTSMLAADISAMGPTLATRELRHLDGVQVVGAHPVYIEDGAVVEPFVLLDAQQGPLLVRHGAHVQAFARLCGPSYVGVDSVVHAGRVAACSIGEQCRVHGEASVSLFVGQANKAHDGFVGHSVIGRWANLGAGTTTSNLKNSYGPVQAWTPHGVRDTGMQFLGALIGDHAKLAIGTLLRTGSVVGAGASVFESSLRTSVVPPFAWGGDTVETFDVEKFLEVAERVLGRRGQPMSDGLRRAFRLAHQLRWDP
ncbi:MAG: putative sugar nucleotidyl transferase [Gemmatimonadota bacterium]|nr:putative sugar nucleotidyl transferase [Gemmatimonadota bacterium]